MDEVFKKEFYDIVGMLDLIFYALKWQSCNNNDDWKYFSTIKILDSTILKLKYFGVNNIGCLED